MSENGESSEGSNASHLNESANDTVIPSENSQDQLAILVASIEILQKSMQDQQQDFQQFRTRIEAAIQPSQPSPLFPGSQLLGWENSVPQYEQPSSSVAQASPPVIHQPKVMMPQVILPSSQPQPQYMQAAQHHQPHFAPPGNYRSGMSGYEEYTPKIYPLPTFSGSPEDWPLFLTSFRDTTAEFGYNNRQNLMRLQKALQGEARRSVTSLLVFPDDVEKIIEELQFNFGRPDLIIRFQIEKLKNFSQISESRLDGILSLSNCVRNIVAFLKSAKCEHHLMNPTLLEQLVAKLPPSKQYEWAKFASKIKPYATIESFSTWISDLAKIISFMPGSSTNSLFQRSSTQSNQMSGQPNTTRRILHSNATDTPKFKCPNCSADHNLINCSAFKKLNSDAKWEKVKQYRVCFGCLRKGHSLLNCHSKKPCNINGCNRFHHQCLHPPSTPETDRVQRDVQSTGHILNCRPSSQVSQFFKILPVVISGPRGSVSVFALFDEGSSISLLEESVANDLGLKGHIQPLTLQWYGKNKTTENSKRVTFEISGDFNNATSFTLRNVRTINDLNLPHQTYMKENYDHMKNLPLASYTDIKPVLLIGLDNSFLGVASKIVEVDGNQPIAALTKLGWVAYGPRNAESNEFTILHIRESRSLKELHKLVDEHFSMENLGIKGTDVVLESDDDKRARKILAETTAKIGSHYEVGLLWRKDDTKLPPSFEMAKNRLLNVEKKMQNNKVYAAKYQEEINKYIQKGYARKLTPEEASRGGSTVWYLPHFGVFNPSKPEKLRIVFDAAAMTFGVSLNSVLLKGPEQAQPLLKILFQFRQGVVAVAGDIQEMFSQVRIRDIDQNAQRFLWRDGNPNKPICIYSMVSMIFGAICSPSIAEYIKNLNATKYLCHMPRGAKAVIENMYVDDLVASFDNENEALQVATEAVEICSGAGFKLRGFISNSKHVQAKLNDIEDNVKKKVFSMERQCSTDKTLGMFWNTDNDTFEFHFKFHKIHPDVLENKRPPTKREILGIVMAVFDPFGFLANLMIFAKLLVQSTWNFNIEWDDALPKPLCRQWRLWWEKFQEVKNFSVARCYSPLLPDIDEIQLHVFVDASSSAYAAVAYFRFKRYNRVEVAFVAAKSRCAPSKGMTVPRLELQAAVLGCRLKNSMVDCHNLHIDKCIFWSDSKTVVLWIRSTERKFKQFVANRVAEILENSLPTQWRWLPSELNVADDATRADPMQTPNQKSRWVAGPEFLKLEEECWPKETTVMVPECPLNEETIQRLMLFKNASKTLTNFTKFSSFLKLRRTMAWVLRFINNCKANGEKCFEEFTASELLAAEKLICREAQMQEFSTEISILQAGKGLSKSSEIYQLSPYLDDEGLIRMNGRIDAAFCVPWTARRPIILPKNHHLSKILMYHFHHKLHHQNDLLTINEMRQRFWVPNARSLLKLVKKDCPTCINNKALPSPPLMGQLPPDRVTPFVRPFTFTGIDYCGPFFVTIGRRREKRWVALFTCLTTRAVHLEVSEDLSTDSFLLCLRNFVNRRGMPVKIRSDNGTNFIGAQKNLKKENRIFDLDMIQREVSNKGIQWIFNCPANPSAGGCWERLVQCVKRILSRVLKEEAPRLETFRNVLIEAENIINSRPLTEIALTAEDEEPLTPNHFLLGCLNSTQTPADENKSVCLRKQWRIAQNLKDRIWKRWVSEYLPQLLKRSKWQQETEPLKPGQLVIVCDPSQPRGQWQRGRIVKVFPSKDGQVRSAEVKVGKSTIRRPACKLAALKYGEPLQGPRGVEC